MCSEMMCSEYKIISSSLYIGGVARRAAVRTGARRRAESAAAKRESARPERRSPDSPRRHEEAVSQVSSHLGEYVSR